jgi:prepilin peptidase CpaA
MQGTHIVYGLVGALAIALTIAAITDIRRRQIDNWLNAAIAHGAPLFWWASGLRCGRVSRSSSVLRS